MTVSFLDIDKGNTFIYSFSLSVAFEIADSDSLALRSMGMIGNASERLKFSLSNQVKGFL